MLSDVKTIFRWNSALIKVLFLSSLLPTTVLRDNERDRARDIYVFGIAYSVRSVYCELEVSFARKTEENQDIQVLVSKGSLNLNCAVFMNVASTWSTNIPQWLVCDKRLGTDDFVKYFKLINVNGSSFQFIVCIPPNPFEADEELVALKCASTIACRFPRFSTKAWREICCLYLSHERLPLLISWKFGETIGFQRCLINAAHSANLTLPGELGKPLACSPS